MSDVLNYDVLLLNWITVDDRQYFEYYSSNEFLIIISLLISTLPLCIEDFVVYFYEYVGYDVYCITCIIIELVTLLLHEEYTVHYVGTMIFHLSKILYTFITRLGAIWTFFSLLSWPYLLQRIRWFWNYIW